MKGDDSHDQMVKFIILGDSKVGKTSFLNQFCYGTFKHNVPCTVGLDYGQRVSKVGDKRILFQIWDTAGQERFRNITPSFYRSAMAIILMYSVDNRESFNSIAIWMKQINSFAHEGIPILLVCNKIDVIRKQISQKQSRSLAETYKIEFMGVSCLEKINIDETVVELYRLLKRNNPNAIFTASKISKKSKSSGLSNSSTPSSLFCKC